LQNVIHMSNVPDYADVTMPIVRDYRAAMTKYAPTLPVNTGIDGGYSPQLPYTFLSLEGFLSTRALMTILERAGRDLTRQSFYRAAESMGKFDIGLGTPLEFSTSRHQALDKVWALTPTADGYKVVTSLNEVLK